MTGKAILRRALVRIVRVAGLAGDIRMGTCQRETRIAMVEGRVLPLARIMAGGTHRPKLTVMGVIFGMAGDTLPRRTFEHAITVTGLALNLSMPAVQRETCLAVIEIHILPGSRLVTASAFRAKLSSMRVLRGVTCITIRGSTFIPSIDVTIRTRDAAVPANQWEAGLAVIEIHILPIAWIVAVGTVPAHLPGMNIRVTGSTVSRGILEEGILMTIFACHTDMFANQWEHRPRMVEIYILPGRRLVAGFAILSQRTFVRVVILVA